MLLEISRSGVFNMFTLGVCKVGGVVGGASLPQFVHQGFGGVD